MSLFFPGLSFSPICVLGVPAEKIQQKKQVEEENNFG